MVRILFEELRLKQARAANSTRKSLQQISDATGIAVSTLHRISNNTYSRIDLSTIERLCDYFGCDFCDLFERVPDPVAKEAA